MAKYRKKPVEIDAVQVSWKTWSEVCDLVGSIISDGNPARHATGYSDHCGDASPYIEFTIPTLEGDMIARHGDWIIRGVKGEFYPCKPDIFVATYEPV